MLFSGMTSQSHATLTARDLRCSEPWFRTNNVSKHLACAVGWRNEPLLVIRNGNRERFAIWTENRGEFRIFLFRPAPGFSAAELTYHVDAEQLDVKSAERLYSRVRPTLPGKTW